MIEKDRNYKSIESNTGERERERERLKQLFIHKPKETILMF